MVNNSNETEFIIGPDGQVTTPFLLACEYASQGIHLHDVNYYTQFLPPELATTIKISGAMNRARNKEQEQKQLAHELGLGIVAGNIFSQIKNFSPCRDTLRNLTIEGRIDWEDNLPDLPNVESTTVGTSLHTIYQRLQDLNENYVVPTKLIDLYKRSIISGKEAQFFRLQANRLAGY